MEEFKSIAELTKMDEKHVLLGCVRGFVPDLEGRHRHISEINLHTGVPDTIRGQFNVARNMALYQYFFYALAQEVQLKTYTIIEMALRQRAGSCKKPRLSDLLQKAASNGWLSDSRFRHIEKPVGSNPYCRSLPDVLPNLRNEAAHGSSRLDWNCIQDLEICADLVNQLFECPAAYV
ncbi:MAG: hypothetical protein WA056_13435 [Gallionella sp.]